MTRGAAATAGVLFDLDGLLIDSEVLWSEADRAFLAERGATPGDEMKSIVMGTTVLESASAMKAAYGLAGTPASTRSRGEPRARFCDVTCRRPGTS